MARAIACKTCAAGITHSVPHGTPSGYMYHGCSCDDCLEWHRGYRVQPNREWRKANRDVLNARDRDRRGGDSAYRARKNRTLRESVRRRGDSYLEYQRDYRETRREAANLRQQEWRQENANYRRLYARGYDQRRQSSITVTRGRGVPWTQQEDLIAAMPGITAMEVAHLTGRSWHASSRRVSMHRMAGAS